MSRSLSVLCVFLSVVTFTACGPVATEKGNTLPPVITEQSIDALKVELLAHEAFHVGQNRVFYRITQKGVALTQATLTQKPMMTMPTHKHGCPLVNPEITANTDGLFEGLLVFNMATMADASWELTVEVSVDQAAPVSINLGKLEVSDSAYKKTLTRPDGRSILLTVGFPDEAQVGTNALRVTAHEPKQMGMMFMPLEDLSFTLTPEMPSMGHGSSGNVSPTLTRAGLYDGKVNFSMAGDWTITLDVKDANSSLGKATFGMSL